MHGCIDARQKNAFRSGRHEKTSAVSMTYAPTRLPVLAAVAWAMRSYMAVALALSTPS